MADSEWRRDRQSLSFTLHYIFSGAEDVTSAWQTVLRAVDGFEKCTNTWYAANAAGGTTLTPDHICAHERLAADQAVKAFMVVVGKQRTQLERARL